MAINTNFPNVRPSLLLDFANSQQLDPRVTFSRSTTAPYYDGKTSVLAEQNLQTYSEQFDNAVWSKFNTTITANSTTAPDGTTTADSLIENTANSIHSMDGSLFSFTGNFTSSVYLKANGRNFVRVYVTQVSPNVNYTSLFDLSLGTIVSTDSGVTSTITSVGNGWYRCTVSALTVGTQVRITVGLQNSTGAIVAYTGDGTSGCYIWGAQLEQRSSATAYNATTTSALTNYIPQLLTAPINAPRFDFNPTTGESLGLLIEQSSTNLLTYSQDFSNAVWTKGNVTITTGANIAPDGTQTAQAIVETAVTNAQNVQQNITKAASAITYTLSVYVKAATRTWATLFIADGSFNGNRAYYNLSTGTLGSIVGNGTPFTSVSSAITSVGNGWYRISLTATSNTATIIIQNIGGASGDGGVSYTGIAGNNAIFVWQAQVEALAFATSPITTTSAQVTRAQDTAQMTGINFSSWYNQNQGTFFADYIANQSLPTTYTAGIFGCGPGAYASTNSSQLFLGSNQIVGYYQPNGYPEMGLYANIKPLTAKISMSYSLTLGTLVVNNSTVITQSGNFPNNGGINSIQLGTRDYNSSANYLNGWIKKFAYYPQQVTTTNQQALTGS
jgi:hypothetical protein